MASYNFFSVYITLTKLRNYDTVFSATEKWAQAHYKTKIVRCDNVLMCMVDLLIMYCYN